MLLIGLALSACSKAYIPNTDVRDTSENRKVILFCEEYRHAVEEKNVGWLLKMASPRYHEDGANMNDADDLDYAGLRDYLTTKFVKATAIRYEIRYRRVTITPLQQVLVDYTYAASYKIPGAKGEEWKHTVGDNQLELKIEGEGFKILAGM